MRSLAVLHLAKIDAEVACALPNRRGCKDLRSVRHRRNLGLGLRCRLGSRGWRWFRLDRHHRNRFFLLGGRGLGTISERLFDLFLARRGGSGRIA
jgi:hypothetical protein